MMELSVYGTWSGLPDEIASEMFANATLRRLKAGEPFSRSVTKATGVSSGQRSTQSQPDISGSQGAHNCDHYPGAVVGDLAVIDGLPRSASVDAFTSCELRFLSRVAFERLALEHPVIPRYLVKLLAARLRQADDIIASLAFLPAKARVAQALLSLAEKVGEVEEGGGVLIPHAINQADIAAMAGVARENTSRILSELEREKLVAKSSGVYRIADKAKLKREIGG